MVQKSPRLPDRYEEGVPHFDGMPKRLFDFFDEVETLPGFQVLAGKDKCQLVLRYANGPSIRQWRKLVTYSGGDWGAFKEDIIASYPAQDLKYSYDVPHLKQLAEDFARRGFFSSCEFECHHRKFIRRCDYIREHRQTRESTLNRWYWSSLPIQFQDMVDRHLFNLGERQDDKIPPINVVYDTVTKLLSGEIGGFAMQEDMTPEDENRMHQQMKSFAFFVWGQLGSLLFTVNEAPTNYRNTHRGSKRVQPGAVTLYNGGPRRGI